jgi:hypothetical protein
MPICKLRRSVPASACHVPAQPDPQCTPTAGQSSSTPQARALLSSFMLSEHRCADSNSITCCVDCNCTGGTTLVRSSLLSRARAHCLAAHGQYAAKPHLGSVCWPCAALKPSAGRAGQCGALAGPQLLTLTDMLAPAPSSPGVCQCSCAVNCTDS